MMMGVLTYHAPTASSMCNPAPPQNPLFVTAPLYSSVCPHLPAAHMCHPVMSLQPLCVPPNTLQHLCVSPSPLQPFFFPLATSSTLSPIYTEASVPCLLHPANPLCPCLLLQPLCVPPSAVQSLCVPLHHTAATLCATLPQSCIPSLRPSAFAACPPTFFCL